jgi:hypothetical protein
LPITTASSITTTLQPDGQNPDRRRHNKTWFS